MCALLVAYRKKMAIIIIILIAFSRTFSGQGLVEGVDWIVSDIASRIYMLE